MFLEALLVFGAAMLVSVLGNILFNYTGIPESILMIILGLLAGPILNVVPADQVELAVPYILTLSLLVVLFESGLSTHISEALRAMKTASVFTCIVLTITMIVCGGVLYFLFGWSLHHSLIMGIICSGTSTPPVVYFTSRMSMKGEVKSFLVFESVFNDITLLTALTLMLQASTLAFNVGSTLGSVVRHLLVAVLYGVVAAIFWVYICLRFSAEIRVKYISTMAFTIILYTVTEAEKGSGILAVLVFSLLLGNLHNITKASQIFSRQIVDFLSKLEEQLNRIRVTQEEISFLAKNLFFFVMGILFDLSSLDGPLLWFTGMLIILIIVSRLISVRLVSFWNETYREYILPVSFMIPRGLTASLAAFIAVQKALGLPLLRQIVTVMVVMTTVATTIGFLVVEKRISREEKVGRI